MQATCEEVSQASCEEVSQVTCEEVSQATCEEVSQATCEEVSQATCEEVLQATCEEVLQATCEEVSQAECEDVLLVDCDEAENFVQKDCEEDSSNTQEKSEDKGDEYLNVDCEGVTSVVGEDITISVKSKANVSVIETLGDDNQRNKDNVITSVKNKETAMISFDGNENANIDGTYSVTSKNACNTNLSDEYVVELECDDSECIDDYAQEYDCEISQTNRHVSKSTLHSNDCARKHHDSLEKSPGHSSENIEKVPVYGIENVKSPSQKTPINVNECEVLECPPSPPYVEVVDLSSEEEETEHFNSMIDPVSKS